MDLSLGGASPYAGAFLPLREIRKCVTEFFALNMIFLYLAGYNTEEEIKNSYR